MDAVRSKRVMLFDPLLATTASPVAELIAIALGLVPLTGCVVNGVGDVLCVMSGRTARFVAAICDWVLVRTAIGNSPAVPKFVGSTETSSCREFCTVEDCG